MTERKLTVGGLEHAFAHERITGLSSVRRLSPEAKSRVMEAVKTGIEHVTARRGLQYGIGGEHAREHVDMAMKHLEEHYSSPHDKQGELAAIKEIYHTHFNIKEHEGEAA
jgi:hypothetical protein